MKKITFILLGLLLAVGISAQDTKKTITSATATSAQPGEEIRLAIDGDKNTFWHSSWGSTSFPVTVTINFAEVEHVDYLRYTPRPGGGNGDWNEVTLSYYDQETKKYQQIGDYVPGSKGTTFDFELPEGGIDTQRFRFTIKSGHGNFASAAEIEAFARNYEKQNAFAAVFQDPLCLELKPGITGSEGIEDPDVKQLVDNLLTDPEGYKKFRVGEYEPYMTVETLNSIMKNSSVYNQYENPTGIYLKEGESCAVMVDGITDYPVGLKIKGGIKDLSASSYTLKNGYNWITAANEGNVFVSYYTDDYKNAPNVKVHLVNAPVRGYWDQETMTNDDWVEMLSKLDANDSTVIITRSKYAQLFYPVCAWKKYCPTNIDSTMTIYQQIQEGERYMMGLPKYGYEIKNRHNFYSLNGGFLFAGGDGAYANINTLYDLTSPDSKIFSFWAVGHEWGHNNQIQGFKWSGLGETSNNVYSSWVQMIYTGNPNWLTLEDENTGVNDYAGMRGGRMETYFEEGLRKGAPWQMQDGPDYHGDADEMVTVMGEDANGNPTGMVTTPKRNFDHFVKVIPFHQLNLWGTRAGKSPDIIPMILQSLRTTDNYTQTYNTVGKQQINWMKLACDSAQINLLPFFEKAGMLKPINRYIEDYGKGWSIITEKMINDLKTYVAEKGYPTPNEEINYINGHNFHIYRDNLKLEVPAQLGTGCTLNQNNTVTVRHDMVKNAVAFETYKANGELLRITMYGLGSDDNHTYTQVLYPSHADEAKAAAYIMAVGYDGTRTKIFEQSNVRIGLADNGYYRIISNGRGNALSCGTSTSVDASGKITWKMNREAKSDRSIEQIWMWQQNGEDTYLLYNPQSDSYFAKKEDGAQTKLYTKADAPAWEATCVDKAKKTFTLSAQGSYLNAYSETQTGFYGGGAGDPNNIWTLERVTTVPVTIPTRAHINICYPFPLEIPEGMTAYVVSSTGAYDFEGTSFDYALLEEIKGNVIPARMPVILNGKSGTYNLNIAESDGEKTTTTNLLHGATLRTSLEKGSFLSTMATSTEAGTTAAIKTGTASSVTANKSYLLKSEVKDAEQLYLSPKSLHDGISGIKAEKDGDQFYDLNGVRADKLQKGHIYVTSEGKKILVK